MEDNQPKGIPFFNIKSGETHYAKLEPQIQAYINSSDMGINASREQDYGWRLGKEWVHMVKAFRRDEAKMGVLVTRNGGQKVTTTQILYAIYGEQLRAAAEREEEESAPFEEQYLADISSKPTKGAVDASPSQPADSAPVLPESSEEVNAVSEGDQPANPAPKPATTSKK